MQVVGFEANDHWDFVHLTLGPIKLRIPYLLALIYAQHLLMAAKRSARHDRVPATFTQALTAENLRDPDVVVHDELRRSPQLQNFYCWQIMSKPHWVRLRFDSIDTDVVYDDAVRLSHLIRRAAHRAKAWAGDRSRIYRSMGNITSAEDNYRLGL